VNRPPGDPVSVTLGTNRAVTATFNPVNRMNLQPANTSYASIQDAYNDADTGGTIKAQNFSFLERVTFADSTIAAINLIGGLGGDYQTVTGYSTIQSLFIQSGMVKVRGIKIKP